MESRTQLIEILKEDIRGFKPETDTSEMIREKARKLIHTLEMLSCLPESKYLGDDQTIHMEIDHFVYGELYTIESREEGTNELIIDVSNNHELTRLQIKEFCRSIKYQLRKYIV